MNCSEGTSLNDDKVLDWRANGLTSENPAICRPFCTFNLSFQLTSYCIKGCFSSLVGITPRFRFCTDATTASLKAAVQGLNKCQKYLENELPAVRNNLNRRYPTEWLQWIYQLYWSALSEKPCWKNNHLIELYKSTRVFILPWETKVAVGAKMEIYDEQMNQGFYETVSVSAQTAHDVPVQSNY